MNRASAIQTIAACEAVAKALRAALKNDARAEFEEQGVAPTWRMPGFTVSGSVTTDRVVVESMEALLWWAERFRPDQVYEDKHIREEWLKEFLVKLTAAGEPVVDSEGTVIPGLRFVRGGEFDKVSIMPNSATRRTLEEVAAAIVAGKLPMPALASLDASQ